ncbi:MAG: DUF2935 domain-containing protein [Clostridia bacterium]|nr:DUF2935 domain-containing protein [Clostridia bacterium]
MLSNREFVSKSLELNLFFLRILKEHALFLEVSFPPKNFDLAQQACFLRGNLNCLLIETINLTEGNISKQVKKSGEIVTKYTCNAEQATQFYTGIPIDMTATSMELSLDTGGGCPDSFTMIKKVEMLNEKAIHAACCIARFKEDLLSNVLKCKVFTVNYPLLIEHILTEAKLYISCLKRLQKKSDVDLTQQLIKQEVFWNRIMAEHSKFIRGLLDPSEESLFKIADNFGNEFDKLTEKAKCIEDRLYLLPKLTYKTIKSVEDIRNFKESATQGLLNCKIKSTILPLLGDHVLREANHYLRLLKSYKFKKR